MALQGSSQHYSNASQAVAVPETTASGSGHPRSTGLTLGSLAVTPRAKSELPPRSPRLADAAPSSPFERPRGRNSLFEMSHAAGILEVPRRGSTAFETPSAPFAMPGPSALRPAAGPSSLLRASAGPASGAASGSAGLPPLQPTTRAMVKIRSRHRKSQSVGSVAELEERRPKLEVSGNRLERLNEDGDPILGGELVVKVVDAQVWLSL